WEAEDFFARIPGVVHTTAGYTGGTSAHPTFHDKVDHTEAVRIEFLPRVISFEEMLTLTCEYVTSFDITDPPIIFYCDEPELERINEWRESARFVTPVADDLVCMPLTMFYTAEQYHQRYLSRLRGEFVAKHS
ncbi:MAG TPA: peptide-methionine (S)-S-oxide reductase, partial [Candidatus Saccharimonadales bacterium]|nr:peptide-methionine (S)-S-oxide reductase [Candidatus Saccharimonadales bacterium]